MSERRGRESSRGESPLDDVVDSVVGSLEAAAETVKPKLRGWIHLVSFPIVVVAGAVLVALAPTTRSRWAVGVFGFSAALLFGISALYHRGTWSPRMHGVLMRIDHSNIFLIIAGTYTPFAVLLLPSGPGRMLLWAIWAAALAGVLFRIFWVSAPRWLYVPAYIVLGWVAVAFTPHFLRRGGPVVLALVLAGGLLYTAGGVIYGLKRPNPSPRWFGFHEVFHVLTVVGFVSHFVGVSLALYEGQTGAS